MENLKHYVLKRELKKLFDNSELPFYAKSLILKELAIEYDKEYYKAVEEEDKELAKLQEAEKKRKEEEEALLDEAKKAEDKMYREVGKSQILDAEIKEK